MKQCVCKKKNTQLPLKKSNFFGFCSSTYLLYLLLQFVLVRQKCALQENYQNIIGKPSTLWFIILKSTFFEKREGSLLLEYFGHQPIYYSSIMHQGLNSEHLLTKGDAFCLLTLDTTTFVLQCIWTRERAMALKPVQQPI